jgi:hypothetical protein
MCSTVYLARSPVRSVVVACILTVAAPPIVRADDGEDLIRRGLELRKHGDDQAALPLLQQAFAQSPSPRAAGQLGFCQQGLGLWAEAEVQLAVALAAENDPWVRKNRSTIERTLAVVRAHIARVEVIGEPDGAEVLINGNQVGRIPLTTAVHVAVGEIEVELRAPGYRRASKAFHVDGGQYQKVVLRLEREAVSSAGGPPPSGAETISAKTAPAAAGPGIATGRPDAQLGQQAVDPGPSAGRASIKWILWGGGAVGLGLGVYGALHNNSVVKQFDSACAIDPMTGHPFATSAGTTAGRCADLRSSYESAAHLGIAGFVAAGALSASGFVAWMLEPSQARAAVALTSCAPGLDARLSPWVSCALRF